MAEAWRLNQALAKPTAVAHHDFKKFPFMEAATAADLALEARTWPAEAATATDQRGAGGGSPSTKAQSYPCMYEGPCNASGLSHGHGKLSENLGFATPQNWGTGENAAA